MTEITTAQKTKAADYLKEFSSQSVEKWINPLINRVIFTHSVPEVDFLDKIYEDFLVAHELKSVKEKSAYSESAVILANAEAVINNKFELKNLKHESGVNALVKGATISFHPKLTVVYGKNGSGKSGFVRILKGVSASRTQEDIWQNINNSIKKNECQVKIMFNDGVDKTFTWNGQGGLVPFSRMGVFDGKCIPIYLTKGLNFSYQPYGFELFQLTSNALNDLQQRLSDQIQKTEENKPPIEDIFNDQTVIGKFIQNMTPSTKIEDLDKLPKWDQKNEQALVANIKESKGLINLDQQSEILQTRLQKITSLQEHLEEIQTETSAASIRTYLRLIK